MESLFKKIFCIFISICGWFVAMGSAAAVPKSGMPPETSPLPATMSPLATLEALQKQKTLSSDQNQARLDWVVKGITWRIIPS